MQVGPTTREVPGNNPLCHGLPNCTGEASGETKPWACITATMPPTRSLRLGCRRRTSQIQQRMTCYFRERMRAAQGLAAPPICTADSVGQTRARGRVRQRVSVTPGTPGVHLNQVLHFPQPIGDASGHRGGDFERLMKAHKIVVHGRGARAATFKLTHYPELRQVVKSRRRRAGSLLPSRFPDSPQPAGFFAAFEPIRPCLLSRAPAGAEFVSARKNSAARSSA